MNVVFWLKFNVYSLLLSLISVGMLISFCMIPFLYQKWYWYIIPIVAIGIIFKAVDIFEQFHHKKVVYEELLSKSKKRYDQRYFMPYMETACMRHVVFWTLHDLGKQFEYRLIKQRYAKEANASVRREIVVLRSGPQKVVEAVMDHHELKFITRN